MRINYKRTIISMYSLLVILSHSIFAYLSNRTISNILYVILSFLPLAYLISKNARILKKTKTLLVSAFIIFFIFTYGLLKVNGSDFFSYVCRYVIFLPCSTFMFIDLIRNRKTYDVFEKMSFYMYYISIISLFFWVFGTTLKIIPPSGSWYLTWGHTYRPLYYGMYIEVAGGIYGSIFQRNVGMFCEGPAFAYLLSLVFSYEVLIKNYSNRKRIALFLITMITTGTSTAILTILFCLIINLWNKTRELNARNIILRVGIIALGVVGTIVFLNMMTMKSKMASVNLRMTDYINGINAFLESPIWGHGYMTDSATNFNTGFSNGLTQILVAGGIMFFSIYAVPYFLSIKQSFQNKHLMYWIILTGILFSISIVGYTYVAISILSFCIALTVSKEDKDSL